MEGQLCFYYLRHISVVLYQLNVVVLSDGESLTRNEKLIIIKEDIGTFAETLVSLILFAVLLLLFILCITGRVAELKYR